MAFLFDTDAISEVMRRRPLPAYVAWLASVPRSEQFTSAVVIGELFEGAFRTETPDRHLDRITRLVLPAITVLPYDAAVAERFGRIQGALAKSGKALADADAIIAATAVHHGLVLVTGNTRHFERVPGLRIETVLARARVPVR